MMGQLTTKEVEICQLAGVNIDDAVFLKGLTNAPIELLEIPNYNDYPTRADKPIIKGIHSYLHYKNASETVLSNYARFLKEGKILFQGETLYLNEKEATERGLLSDTSGIATICLLSTICDPYKVIEAYGTSWPNCCITNEVVIKKLKEWEEWLGLTIYHISDNFISARLLTCIIDYEALAIDIFAMCANPENIQHSMKEEIEEIKKTGNITLWWD